MNRVFVLNQVVGTYTNREDTNACITEFIGVFSSREEARDAASLDKNWLYIIHEINLGDIASTDPHMNIGSALEYINPTKRQYVYFHKNSGDLIRISSQEEADRTKAIEIKKIESELRKVIPDRI